jgi:hypothetical protein
VKKNNSVVVDREAGISTDEFHALSRELQSQAPRMRILAPLLNGAQVKTITRDKKELQLHFADTHVQPFLHALATDYPIQQLLPARVGTDVAYILEHKSIDPLNEHAIHLHREAPTLYSFILPSPVRMGSVPQARISEDILTILQSLYDITSQFYDLVSTLLISYLYSVSRMYSHGH